MKKRKPAKQMLALAAAASLLIPAAFAVNADTASAASDSDDSFYQALAELVNSRDDSAYFDVMELTIGSSVLTVDGESQQMDVAPDVLNQRTMLPIRPIAEAAGADVSYDAASNSAVIISTAGDEIRFSIGASEMSVNDELSTLDVASYASNGRTYLPVRAVAEALDMEVEWNQDTSTVALTAPYQSCRVLAWADAVDTSSMNPTAVLNSGSGMWVLQFETPGQAKAAVEILSSQGVEAEPDLYIPPIWDEAETDSFTAQGSHYTWGAGDCHFDEFLALYGGTFTSSGVVAVVDSGVDSSHAFLRGRVLSGYDFVDGDSTPNDGNSHGTHVAGTIIDCVGNAPVNILPVRVLNNRGSGMTSTVAAGIQYAASHGADVINLSLGGGHSASIDNAIRDAISRGSLVAIAAGNDNRSTSAECPAHLTMAGSVIVSAGDSDHTKAYFSNYGSNVDLMAPGVQIRAAVPGGTYSSKSGTSMATPHAAAAAMLLDLAWGKTLSPAALEAQLRTATSRGTWTDQYMGCGFLDLSKAAPPNGVVLPTPTPSPTVTSYRFSTSSLTLNVGETASITVTAVYSDGSTKTVTTSCGLYSSNTSVATVSNGIVTARQAGTAQLTIGSPASGASVPTPVTITVQAPVAPTPTPAPTPAPPAPGTDGMTLTLGTPTPSSNNKRMQLSLSISYSGSVPTRVLLYIGGTPDSLNRQAREFITPTSNPFLYSRTYRISSHYNPGDVVYYQFVVMTGEEAYPFGPGDAEYQSEIGSFVVPGTPASTPAPANTSTGYAVKTDGYLAINDKAAVSPGWSNEIGAIPEGAAVTVYTDKTSGSWYYVTYNGVSGWAHKSYITFNTRTGVVHDAGHLAINDKPAVSPGWSREIGTIPDGATVRVYPDVTSGSWYYVTYNGITGWAHKSYITLQ